MKGKDVLKGLIDAGRPVEQGQIAPSQRPAGAIKALSMGLNRLSEEAAEARHLRETLIRAENVVEVHPSIIDASIVADRLIPKSDVAFQELKAAIMSSGQQVPVLLRPNPDVEGRYQAAYGHRRIRAAQELEITVKAIIRPLTDEQMVVAQGQENGSRVDLSFIERALFASRLEGRGFDRDTIGLALSIDKPEVSRLLTVAGSIDHSIIEAIGPAQKVGRPRWLQLAEALKTSDSLQKVVALTSTERFNSADSDGRFKLVLNAAALGPETTEPNRKEFKMGNLNVAMLERKGNKSKLLISDTNFADFLEARMTDLINEFLGNSD